MKNFPISSFLFSVFAFAGTLGQDSTTVSVDKSSIAQLIDDTVSAAKIGIESTDLRNSLESIQQLADSFLNSRGALVDGQDIIDVIGNITAKNNWQLTLSALLEDPLVQEQRKVSAGIFVLNALSLGLKILGDDSQENSLVAAISFTAKSVERSVAIGETLFNYQEENIGNQNKRWTGLDKYTPYYIRSSGEHNVNRRNIRRKRWGISVGGSIGIGFG